MKQTKMKWYCFYYVKTILSVKMHRNALKRIHAITATREVYKTESTRVMPLVMDSRIRRHCEWPE